MSWTSFVIFSSRTRCLIITVFLQWFPDPKWGFLILVIAETVINIGIEVRLNAWWVGHMLS